MVMDILVDTLHDTVLMLPLLFLSYLVIEYFDRRDNNDDKMFLSLQQYGPLIGAFVGLIPQCGFSILAAMLFISKNITMGTLIAVLIATSDEAIPILLSNPLLYPSLLSIFVCKVLIAIAVGYFVDKILIRKQQLNFFSEMEDEVGNEEEKENSGNESACPCCYTQYPMGISALLRSLKIFVFLFTTTLLLNALMHTVGEETLRQLLLSDSIFQPVLAALFGFIPNCAASVVLTQLYVSGTVSFASLTAGLITNAGLGIIVLIKYKAKRKEILQIMSILLVTAVLAGFILSMMQIAF